MPPWEKYTSVCNLLLLFSAETPRNNTCLYFKQEICCQIHKNGKQEQQQQKKSATTALVLKWQCTRTALDMLFFS